MLDWDRSLQFLKITLPLTPTLIRYSTEVAEEGLVVVIAAQVAPDPVGRGRTVIEPGGSHQGKIVVPQEGGTTRSSAQ